MYKSRFTRWGIYKYARRVKEASDPVSSHGASAPTLPELELASSSFVATVPGRRKAHIRHSYAKPVHSSKAGFRPRHADNTSTALATLLQAPDDLRLPEECISIMYNFALGATEQGLWELDGAGILAPDEELNRWNNLTAVSLVLLPRRTEAAFRVLQACFDRYKDLLLQEQEHQQQRQQQLEQGQGQGQGEGKGKGNGRGDRTPWLFVSAYAFVLRTARAHPELARCFLHYARDLARIIRPAGHPYCRVLDTMCRMGPARLESYAAGLLGSCLAAIERHFGPDSYCMAHALVYATEACVARGSVAPDVARSKLQGLLTQMEGGGDGGGGSSGNGINTSTEQNFIPSIRLGVMRASYREGDHRAAQEIVRQIPASLPEWCMTAKVMSLIYEEPPSVHTDIIYIGAEWGAYMKKNLIVNPWIVSPLVEVHAYLEKYGDQPYAQPAREYMEEGLEMLCEMVCNMKLSGPRKGLPLDPAELVMYEESP